MNVSITGGSGFIGKLLSAALAARGDRITQLSRRDGMPERSARCVKGDLVTGGDALVEFVQDCDVVYHCAGEVKNTALMYALHVGGTRNLLKAVSEEIMRTGRAIHWVQLSSTGAYGPQAKAASLPSNVDEHFTPAPVGEYEVTKTIADELVVALASMQPLFTYTIIRPSIVIGKDMSNQSFFQMANIVRKRLFFYIGEQGALSTYVHVDDVVRALLICSTDRRAVGETFIVSNDCLLKEVIDQMARSQGVPAPRLRMPEGAVRMLTRVLSPLVRLPLTQERVDALTKRVGYSAAHIKSILGFEFNSSIPEAVPGLISARTEQVS